MQVGSSNSHVVVGIALLVVVLIISPVIIILVRKVTRTLQVSERTQRLGLSCLPYNLQTYRVIKLDHMRMHDFHFAPHNTSH